VGVSRVRRPHLNWSILVLDLNYVKFLQV
jgi:hypothetical protein